jgi:hypothetical protein
MKQDIINFRKALDKINWGEIPIGFTDFPCGTCGDVSDILAEYLYTKGFENILYVCGEYNGSSHAWLEMEGLAIDITADQFLDIQEKVLIQSPSIWHNKYKESSRRKAGYKDMNGMALHGVTVVHNEVLNQLNA